MRRNDKWQSQLVGWFDWLNLLNWFNQKIQISNAKLQITDNGHGTRITDTKHEHEHVSPARSSKAVCRPPSSVLIITDTDMKP